jgi:hypothetical protein
MMGSPTSRDVEARAEERIGRLIPQLASKRADDKRSSNKKNLIRHE